MYIDRGIERYKGDVCLADENVAFIFIQVGT